MYKKNQRRVLRKPDCLPISTEAEMIVFETVSEEIYEEVVSCRKNKKYVNLCK